MITGNKTTAHLAWPDLRFLVWGRGASEGLGTTGI